MKKLIIAVVAIIVVSAGIGSYLLFTRNQGIVSSASLGNGASSPSVTACDVLTKDAASSLLGDDISQPSGSTGDVSTTDIAVTTCSYTTNAHTTNTTSQKTSGVSVLARVARTSAGASSNQDQFQHQPADVQNVKGIGDAAFYNPDFRQLNVLKGNNWYIVTYYRDTITNATADSDKQLAQQLRFK